MNKEKLLHQIIRVDHAGEFAAIQIYKGQLKRFSSNNQLGNTIQEMYITEEQHLDFFTKEMQKDKVRPTALLPIWRLAGYSLGYISALFGEKAAMACTVAVEEVISDHYQEQIDLLQRYNIKDEIFLNNIIKIREEEIEHKDTGIEMEAEQAPLYKVASRIIKSGCKFAIFLSKRI